MEQYSIVIFLLAVMLGLSAIASKVKIPYPVFLIIAGIALGFVPSIPDIEIDPEIIFLIFLPPLLYDAAFNISFKDFRTNLSTITSLAIGLVFLTASGIAVFAYYVIPGMTWPLSFLLGSILAATDAVAAISITKGLGLSHKAATILEGESLINDASALVAYRFSIAALTGTAFVIWKAYLEFLLLMGGGFLVGVVVGKLLGWILRAVHKDRLVTIAFMLLAPFVTYLIAEELHVSGVIAVVTLGLSIARLSTIVFPDELKTQSKTIWDTLVFMLNGLIFILIGLELPVVIKHISIERLWTLVGYSFAITVVALVVRMARIFLKKLNLQRGIRRKKTRVTEDQLLDSRTSFIISWSGMRGIVSLALAIGIPVTMDNGERFPLRDEIIFISVAVVLFTLIGQGLTLPWVIRRLKPKEDGV